MHVHSLEVTPFYCPVSHYITLYSSVKRAVSLACDVHMYALRHFHRHLNFFGSWFILQKEDHITHIFLTSNASGSLVKGPGSSNLPL